MMNLWTSSCLIIFGQPHLRQCGWQWQIWTTLQICSTKVTSCPFPFLRLPPRHNHRIRKKMTRLEGAVTSRPSGLKQCRGTLQWRPKKPEAQTGVLQTNKYQKAVMNTTKRSNRRRQWKKDLTLMPVWWRTLKCPPPSVYPNFTSTCSDRRPECLTGLRRIVWHWWECVHLKLRTSSVSSTKITFASHPYLKCGNEPEFFIITKICIKLHHILSD